MAIELVAEALEPAQGLHALEVSEGGEGLPDTWVFLKTVYIRNEQNVTDLHRLF